LFLILVPILPLKADVKSVLPDFYAAPGVDPFRDQVQANLNEVIDPFSGGLHLSHVDMFIPGNGGFDIKVIRSYNSSNVYKSHKTPWNQGPYLTELLSRSTAGLGWTIHFGRILRSEDPDLPGLGICGTNPNHLPPDTLDNPVLELPDGCQQVLYEDATTATDARFISKQNWVAYCNTDGSALVISPDGTKYTMSHYKRGQQTYTLQTDQAWYTTRIEDRNGNYLTIDYDTTAVSYGLGVALKRITASDGRIVDFTYTDRTLPDKIRLASITANGQTWTYGYTLLAGYSSTHFLLTNVTRPDGLSWDYTYHDKVAGQPGDNILKQVTYPYGATVTYDYGYICFNATTCSSAYDSFYSLVVTSKINGGRDVAPATWTYSYASSSTEDVTTVTFPGGKYVYRHYGIKTVFNASATVRNLWRTGLLKEKQTYSGTALVNQELYTWQNLNVISNEEHVLPPYDGSVYPYIRYSDDNVYAPVLTQKQIIRDGATYTTTYSNFDASYNPRTITETGQEARTTDITYFPRNAGQNIVSLVKDETISGELAGKNIYRTFDTKGNLTRITRRGVQEDYTYFSTGDLNTKKNARGFVWTFSNYYRGVPRTVAEPEAVTTTRVVDATGTISQETNGRGYATGYSYDGMNRLVGIDPPAGTSVSISWGSTGRTVTRGTYKQTTVFDGFGRPSEINTNGVTQDIDYDPLGYKSFESYLSSSAGTTYDNRAGPANSDSPISGSLAP
jgi:hypothetical protein